MSSYRGHSNLSLRMTMVNTAHGTNMSTSAVLRPTTTTPRNITCILQLSKGCLEQNSLHLTDINTSVGVNIDLCVKTLTARQR